MKNIYSRTLIGVKKGLTTPTLSPEMLEFQRKPLIRLLRVIGGISMLLLLGGGRGYFEIHGFLLYGLFITSLIFCIYHFYISYHRFKHIKFLFKSGALDIRY
jgi:hypothetical protein